MTHDFFDCIDGLESFSIIKDGLYKDTYRCLYKGRRAILSHYQIDINPFNIDPKREFNLLSSIEQIKLTPEPLFYDEELKIMIVTEVEGEHILQSTNRKSLLSSLAKSLIFLHSYPVDDFDYAFHDSLIAYGRQMENEDEKSVFKAAIELHDSLSDEHGKYCLCHNDLHPENVLCSDQIQFIDWEYASLNLPYFDLAYAIEHFEMSESEILYFLSEYGLATQDIDIETLEQFGKLSKYVTLIWLLILNKCYTIKPSETKLMTSLKTELNV